MPSYTTVQSGYWSDPETWSPNGVPKEGDTVTIEAGHTVILDLDLSGFPNGLAGLTVNGTLLIPSLNDPSYEVGEETSGTPWLEGWSYRRTVFVDNSFSSTTLTDFQIIVRVNTAYLIEQGKMREDCGDIRVTDADGNLLPIWIDPDTKNLWNTKVYVKVPLIPAGSVVTLYLFYGNPSATDVSDASAVFDFFDDFSGTTLDETKWTAARWYGSGTWSVAVNDGYVEISTGSGTRAGIVSNVAFPLPFIVEGKYVYVSGDHVWNSITQTTGGSHSDLVEHGYDSSGTYYTYRKASGGSYSNYQRFARYAPRGSIFTRFAIEWLTNASRYYEWDIQVNSNTNQDRYTSGSCYLQLSTYNNGISRWDWIAVRKYAATPPAVYFSRALMQTALKVNANIAGSGALVVGSSSFPLPKLQKALILLNGQLTVATLQVYGEVEERYHDFLAENAAQWSQTIKLRDGLPLRKGDWIAIGRTDITSSDSSSEPNVQMFMVMSYDATEKIVTLNYPLPHARTATIADLDGQLLHRALVIKLMHSPVEILKFGGNNVRVVPGSGRDIQGAFFRVLPGGSSYGFLDGSGTFTGCIFFFSAALPENTNSWKTLNKCVFYRTSSGRDVSNYTLDNCVSISTNFGYSDDSHAGTCTYRNSIFQNFSTLYATSGSSHRAFPVTGRGLYVRFEGCTFIHGGWVLTGLATAGLMRDCVCLVSSALSDVKNFLIENVNIVSPVAADIYNMVFAFNRIEHSWIRNVKVKDGSILHWSSGNIIREARANSHLAIVSSGNHFVNCSYEGTNSAHNLSYWDCGKNKFVDTSTLINLTNLVSFPHMSDRATFHPHLYVDIENINGDRLRRRFLHYGRIEETTPKTFLFRLTNNNFSLPVHYQFVVGVVSRVRVSGEITQIGSGERIVIGIAPVTKDPLLTGEFEYVQEFTQTGQFDIDWLLSDTEVWVVHILAYLNQTTNPITIANLEVTGGGTGGGGGSQNFFISEQMNVLASEAVSTQVLAQVAVDSAIISSERVEPLVQASVSDSMQASTVESVTTQVFATPSESVQISAVEYTVTDLSVIASESAQVQAVDAIMPELSIAASETMQVNASEATAISLPVGISEIVQIQTDESVTVPVSIDANETTQLLSTDSVTTTIGLTVAQTEQIVIDEDVQITDFRGVQIEVSDSVQIIATEIESTDIVIDMTQTESIVVDESPSTQLGISVSDAMQSTLDETVTTAIQPQLSESVRVTTLEESTTDIQISAQTQTEVSATDVASATIGVAVADSEIISATEASSTTVAPSVSEVVRVTTVEQPVSQIQLSAVESVTQIETETGQFVGLVQRIMTPLGVDLENVVGIDISIQPIQLEAGVE